MRPIQYDVGSEGFAAGSCSLHKFPDTTDEVVRTMPSESLWRRQGGVLYPFHSEDAVRTRGYTISKTTVPDREIQGCKTFWKPYSAICPLQTVPDNHYVKALPSNVYYLRQGKEFLKVPSREVLPMYPTSMTVSDDTMKKCPREKIVSFQQVCSVDALLDKTVTKASPSGRYYRRDGWKLFQYADADTLASHGIDPKTVSRTVDDSLLAQCPTEIIQVVAPRPCGVAQLPDGSVVQGSRTIYWKENGVLRLYPSLEIYKSYGSPRVTHRVSDASIMACPKGPSMPSNPIDPAHFEDGTVFRTLQQTMYHKEAGVLRPIPDVMTLEYHNLPAPTIVDVVDRLADAMPKGTEYTKPNNDAYLNAMLERMPDPCILIHPTGFQVLRARKSSYVQFGTTYYRHFFHYIDQHYASSETTLRQLPRIKVSYDFWLTVERSPYKVATQLYAEPAYLAFLNNTAQYGLNDPTLSVDTFLAKQPDPAVLVEPEGNYVARKGKKLIYADKTVIATDPVYKHLPRINLNRGQWTEALLKHYVQFGNDLAPEKYRLTIS